MDFDSYLSSADALRQTESEQGSLLHPGQLLGGLCVVAFLGRGATSEVWRVHDLKQDRDYALKIFAPTANTPEHAQQRFLTEAQALDEFRHPNLMRRYRLQKTGFSQSCTGSPARFRYVGTTCELLACMQPSFSTSVSVPLGSVHERPHRLRIRLVESASGRAIGRLVRTDEANRVGRHAVRPHRHDRRTRPVRIMHGPGVCLV